MHTNALYLQQLVEMGFSETRATKALVLVRNGSVDAALQWLAEHEDDPDIDEPLAETCVGESSSCAVGVASTSDPDPVVGVPSLGMPSAASLPVVVHPDGEESPAMVIGVSGDCKVVLVIPSELNMSPGKIASQCAHAAVGMYRVMMVSQVPWLATWESQGEKTVVLSTDTCEELGALMARAEELMLMVYMVEDAGRTEVQSGSRTVLAIAGLTEMVDQVTGHLQTL
eukprot:evm.model.scf_434.5 EVM.evm.TU.scf_434.5   scf_434:72530-77027(-)